MAGTRRRSDEEGRFNVLIVPWASAVPALLMDKSFISRTRLKRGLQDMRRRRYTRAEARAYYESKAGEPASLLIFSSCRIPGVFVPGGHLDISPGIYSREPGRQSTAKSRRDGRDFHRPSGTRMMMTAGPPSDESLGYYPPPLPGLKMSLPASRRFSFL